MKSTETMESRLKRVNMHDYFLRRIDDCMKKKNYIEASWLIYSCFENRYYRIVEKVRKNCKYCRAKGKCNNKDKNTLALATKINCVKRLYNGGVSCFKQAFNCEIFQDTLKWVKDRNGLMHELLSLEFYENTDERFRVNAERGLTLLKDTYRCCTEFRRLFYDEEYVFIFPEKAMEECSCKPRKKEVQS